MTHCVYCGLETTPAQNDEAVCESCAGELSKGRKPPQPEGRFDGSPAVLEQLLQSIASGQS